MLTFKEYFRTFLRVLFCMLDVITHQFFRMIYGSSGRKAPPISNPLLLNSATEIAFKIRTKKVKCIDVLESYIARIEEINPVLNCVVTDRYEEARNEAKKIDELLESDMQPIDVLEREKPFLGVPFTTKDCISVEGMRLTSGLKCRKDKIAKVDATAIKHLRNAGAIPIALTNVPEVCMWWETYNLIFGRTRNPYDTNRIVGGSSGGEGCLQGAAGSAFGIGSDIGGSIRMPAYFNGIFGHKPSPLVVSNSDHYPPPSSDEHNYYLGTGPMCRLSTDLLPILKIISAGNNEKLKLDEVVDVKKLNIFYQEDLQGQMFVSPVNHEIHALFGSIAKYFEKKFDKKVTKLEVKRFEKSMKIWFAGMKSKGTTFQQVLTDLNGNVNLPLEFFKWIFRCSNHTFIALCTAVQENSGAKYGDPQHLHLLNEMRELRKELLEILRDDGVIILPVHPTVAPYHNEPLFKPFNFCYTAIINMMGLPATSVPMGLNSEGVPLGLQVISAPNNDRFCIAVAKELEKAFGGWVPPQLE